MFRVFDIPSDRPAHRVDDPTFVRPPTHGTKRWIDLQDPTPEDLEKLRVAFGFHPLALEDCLNLDQRPKLESYGDQLFIVTQSFRCPSSDAGEIELLELHAFLGVDYLVTVHTGTFQAVDAVHKRLDGEPVLATKGVDFIYYMIADELVDANFPILDVLSDALEDIEETILHSPEPSQLQRIFRLKRSLVQMRRVLSPQRDVFALLVKGADPRISDKTALYLRDVYDHLIRIYESIDTVRDLLGNDVDAYLSVASNRTNDIMKRLTIMSAIFLPLSFVTGFFGQNFAHLPFENDYLMYSMIALCVLIPSGMLFWFSRSKWL
jgi:magnesium transporter